MAAFRLMPFFYAKYFSSQIRITLIILISLIIEPITAEHLPEYPDNSSLLFLYIIIEFLVGTIIGLTAKIYFLAIDIVGSIIAMQSGLSAATFFDPTQHSQVSLISNFLLVISTSAIIASDTHFVMLEAMIESYLIFKAGNFPIINELSGHVAHLVNNSFILAFKLASPFIAVSLSMLLAGGVLSRLMPNLQVFFVLTPLQIAAMYGVLLLVVNSMVAKLATNISLAVKFNLS